MLNNEILEKYEIECIKHLNKENVLYIIKYLESEKVDYIDELLEDYLDLFVIDYSEFKNRFEKLKEKYGENLVENIANDLTILEEF